ncbi:MAG TPA: ABC transporter permease, partial [Blastocatellia bacterium]
MNGISMMPEWKEEIGRRLAGLKLDPARESEIVEELSQHLDDQYRELLAGGVSEDEARRIALQELSEGEWLQRELRRVERPAVHQPVILGARRVNMIGDLWQDLRYGSRMLGKNPGFTAVIVLTLALGIGVNTSIFSLVNAVLLRPLPVVKNSEQLVWFRAPSSYPNYEDYRDQNDVFSGITALSGTQSFSLNTDGQPEMIKGEFVTANYFSVLGVDPAMGRAFLPEEDAPGSHPIVVISHNLWQRRFGADANLAGRTITINGLSFTVV